MIHRCIGLVGKSLIWTISYSIEVHFYLLVHWQAKPIHFACLGLQCLAATCGEFKGIIILDLEHVE